MPDPRIWLITESATPSGMGRHMLDLAMGLAADHEVTLVAPRTTGSIAFFAEAARLGFPTVALPAGGPEVQAVVLESRLVRAQPDLVHVHAGIGWEGHNAARVARLAGVPGIVRTEHLPDLIHTRWQRVEAAAGLALVDRIICVSDGVAATHLRAGAPRDRLRVVRNGIRAVVPRRGREAHRAALGVDPDAPLAVTVGRLVPQKAHDVLLAAVPLVVAAVPEARFGIVGEGPLEDQLRDDVERLGLAERVRFSRKIDDVPGLLAAADLLVLPSRFEGLPLVALEAMAVGRPIVGTQVVGIDEAVVPGFTGLLVPPDDAVALADAIVRALTDQARVGWGENARRRHARHFTAGRMARETAAIYAEVMAERAATRTAATTPVALPAEDVMGELVGVG